MKIVFMGTPEFAVPSLQILLSSRHQVIAVVTAPDAPRGRGQKVSPTPIKEEALRHHIPILQPAALKDSSFVEELKKLNADVFVVVAFRILPREVFILPNKGTFNLHASMLPKYRGAAPINWAIMNGETETGVTTFFIQEKVDTGNIILQKKISVGENETAGELHDRLSTIGAEAVIETLNLIEQGNVITHKQDDSLTSPAPKIFHETCRIDWTKTTKDIHDFIRGLSPHPAAWTMYHEMQLKIYRTKICSDHTLDLPGTILSEKDTLIVSTSNGVIEILELKPEGRKLMSADDFLRGYKLARGERLS